MQTEYTIGMAVAYAGMLADIDRVQDIETHYNPAGTVYFGRVVTRGAGVQLIVHPDAAAEITDEKLVRGIVVATHEVASRELGGGELPGYAASQPVPVLRKGRIWVLAENTITEGTSIVHVRYAGTGNLGALRGAAVTDETALLPKSKWKSSTSGNNQLAILEIDL